ncbi:MAG: hypothetical protein R2856_03275 [Caldilineaceae bacterium]
MPTTKTLADLLAVAPSTDGGQRLYRIRAKSSPRCSPARGGDAFLGIDRPAKPNRQAFLTEGEDAGVSRVGYFADGFRS